MEPKAWLLCTAILAVSLSTTVLAATITVAKDGSGDYSTVMEAVNAASSNTEILIKPGNYKEMITVSSGKNGITFRGSTGSSSDVVLTYDNSAGTPKPDGGTYGTSGSASVTILADDFQAYDLTFENAFDEAAHADQGDHQAVALRSIGDRVILNNVRILGNQDTLLLNARSNTEFSRTYVVNSWIEGDVDFIFGSGTAVFEDSVINSLYRDSSSNNGYATAGSHQSANPYGYLFINTEFRSNSPDKSFYLGRPWHPSGDEQAIAQVLIRECELGAHIRDDPWTDMSGFSWRDARFSEYKNTGPGSGVNSNRPQLADNQASNYEVADYLTGWQPQ